MCIRDRFFFAFGVFYRRHEARFRQHWALTATYAALLIGGSALSLHGMNLTPKPYDVATLPVTGIIGFLMTHHIATVIDRHPGRLRSLLCYCGDNTLYVFVFHICAFKVVSAIKIMVYGLDWHQIGTHMVVHLNSDTDGFFLLYTIAGTALPLLCHRLYRRLAARH